MIAKWTWRIAIGVFIWMIYQAHVNKFADHIETSTESEESNESLMCYKGECYGV